MELCFGFWQHGSSDSYTDNSNDNDMIPTWCLCMNQGKIVMFQALCYNRLFTLSLNSWQDAYRTDARKHICIPCSPDLGNWLHNRSYEVGIKVNLPKACKTDNAEEFNKISNNICAAKQKKSLVSRKCRELDHKPITGVPFPHVRWQTDWILVPFFFLRTGIPVSK